MVSKRPEDLPHPYVWRRFERSKPDGSVIKFKIQDLPEEMHQEAIKFMVNYFMKDETINKALGIENEELAIEEFCKLQTSFIADKMIFVCFLDDDTNNDAINNKPEILGFTMMTHKRKDDTDSLKANSKAISTLFQIFKMMGEIDDAFERYNVAEIAGGCGLSVHPDYRGFGIGTEFLRARNELCKVFGYRVTTAIFTSTTSQRTATKAGYDMYQQIPYKVIEERLKTKIDTNSEHLKLMSCVLK